MSKKVKLNVTLLKNGADITAPETFIEGYSAAGVVDFDKDEIDAILYKKLGGRKEPDWLKVLKNKVIGADIAAFFPENQVSGATLFIKVRDRVFAINFGTLGRFNISKDAIDKKFGIYTANKILQDDENAKIKSAYSRVNETNPVNKQRQYGENISNNQLFLSMDDNEALKELAIFNKESEDFYRLIGKYNSLNVQFVFLETEMPCLPHLPAKLEKLLDIYLSVTKDDIRLLFKGIFPLDEDESIVLDAQLANKIVSEQDSFFLFEAEIDFDLSQVSRFKIVTDVGDSEGDELSLENYLALRNTPLLSDLKEDCLCVLNEDDTTIKNWSVYDCIYGEIEINGTNYILSHGEWFEVNRDKYSRITTKIDGILDTTFVLPDEVKNLSKAAVAAAQAQRQNPKDKVNKENLFNRELCSHLNGQFFDEAIKQITIYESKFEVCDVLIPQERKFIHVKYNYGASALSHLFNQGFVSGKSYGEYKDDYVVNVNAHIADQNQQIPANNQGAIIHYLIINDKQKDKLTFFSKMVLEDRVRTLEAMGFVVKLSWIRGVY